MFEKLLSLEAERRTQIINAALREFAAQGYDKASTNVIAKDAGMSKPLMFHYIASKKDFFIFLYDYCLDFLKKEYFSKIDKTEKDLLERLRQTCLLKIEVMRQYPWIFDFTQIAVCEDSSEIVEIIKEKRRSLEEDTLKEFYGDIDTSKFKRGLNAEKAKELIFWAVSGFAMKVLDNTRQSNVAEMPYEDICGIFDEYLDVLKKAFYEEVL